MSRTDKHRPYWVRLADAPLRTSQAHHDHRFGPCTLAEGVTSESVQSRRGGCYWTFGPELFGFRLDHCGSEATRWAAEANHRDRREVRRELRRLRDTSRSA